MSSNRSTIALALVISAAAHAGVIWTLGESLPARAAAGERAVSVSLMPALDAILNSVPAPAIAGVPPREIRPVAATRVPVVDEPDAVVAPRPAASVELVDARPAEPLEATAVESLEATAVELLEPEKTTHARDRTTIRTAAVSNASIGEAVEGSPGGDDAAGFEAAAAGPSGADRLARPAPGNPPPRYPWRARVRGHEGRVVLSVWVGADGGAERLAVAQSSGHAALDRAAVEAVEQWQFEPARRSGVDTPSIVYLPVIFRLDD